MSDKQAKMIRAAYSRRLHELQAELEELQAELDYAATGTVRTMSVQFFEDFQRDLKEVSRQFNEDYAAQGFIAYKNVEVKLTRDYNGTSQVCILADAYHDSVHEIVKKGEYVKKSDLKKDKKKWWKR